MKHRIVAVAFSIISLLYSNQTFSQWVQTSGPTGNIRAFTSSGTNIYAGTYRGVCLSTNYGGYWNPVNNGLPNSVVTSIISSGSDIFAAISGVYLDALGREVETLVNEQQSPGVYEVTFNASPYPSGVYFYRLTTDNFTETKRMVMIK